jgi:hypothetical protein
MLKLERKREQRVLVQIYGKYSSPEYYYTLQEIVHATERRGVAQRFHEVFTIESVPMFETHFDYFLKDLKRTCPDIIARQRKNAPVILLNGSEHVRHVGALVEYIFERLGVARTIWVADYV